MHDIYIYIIIHNVHTHYIAICDERIVMSGCVCSTVQTNRRVVPDRKHMVPLDDTGSVLSFFICVFQFGLCVCMSFDACLVYAVRPHTLSSFRLRPLEFPGLLCDFRGVERCRAGPRVAE